MKVFHPYLSFGRYGCEVKKDVDVNHGKYKIQKKKNFRTTLQLVTRSVVIICMSESCNGDSFHFTRHPLITLARVLA